MPESPTSNTSDQEPEKKPGKLKLSLKKNRGENPSLDESSEATSKEEKKELKKPLLKIPGKAAKEGASIPASKEEASKKPSLKIPETPKKSVDNEPVTSPKPQLNISGSDKQKATQSKPEEPVKPKLNIPSKDSITANKLSSQLPPSESEEIDTSPVAEETNTEAEETPAISEPPTAKPKLKVKTEADSGEEAEADKHEPTEKPESEKRVKPEKEIAEDKTEAKKNPMLTLLVALLVIVVLGGGAFYLISLLMGGNVSEPVANEAADPSLQTNQYSPSSIAQRLSSPIERAQVVVSKSENRVDQVDSISSVAEVTREDTTSMEQDTPSGGDTIPLNKGNAFIQSLTLNAVRADSENTLIIVEGVAYQIGDVLNEELQVHFSEIDEQLRQIVFSDANGNSYPVDY